MSTYVGLSDDNMTSVQLLSQVKTVGFPGNTEFFQREREAYSS